MNKSVFVYRKFDQYSLYELEHNLIHMTNPILFNDPYDCFLDINKEQLYDYLTNNSECFNKMVLKLKKEYQKQIKTINNKDVEDKIRNKGDFMPQIEKFKWHCIHLWKSQILVSCFSTKIDKPLLWTIYSNYGKGFVLEYSKNDIKKSAEKKICIDSKGKENNKDKILFRNVSYRNYKVDGTQEACKTIQNELNHRKNRPLIQENFELYEALVFTKDKEWKYEHETRLVIPNTNNSTIDYLTEIKPKAIYIGEFINPYDLYILCNIANSLGIDIYEMNTTSINNRFFMNGQKMTRCRLLKIIGGEINE